MRASVASSATTPPIYHDPKPHPAPLQGTALPSPATYLGCCIYAQPRWHGALPHRCPFCIAFDRSMSGPGQHHSSGADPGLALSRHTPSRDGAAAADHRAQNYNFYTHPGRVSILDGNGDLTIDPTAFLLCSSGQPTPTMEDTGSAMWRSSTNLPSFSRVFDLFTNGDPDDVSDDGEDRFFIPSYLQSSTYMRKLQEAHRSRAHSRREQKRNGTMSSSNGFSSDLLPTGSHRGLSHTVVERGTLSEDRDGLSPLPTRWNKSDMSGGLDLHTDGLGVKYVEIKGHLDRDHEACGIRADHHMPLQCGIYYFEVQILSGRRDECVSQFPFESYCANTVQDLDCYWLF